MKKAAVIPAALVFAFFPVFALQAERLSTPLPLPKVVFSANSEIVLSESRLRSTLVVARFPDDPGKKYELSAPCATILKPVWSEVSPSGIRTEAFPVSVSAACPAKKIEFSLKLSGKTVRNSGLSVPALRDAELFSDLSDLSDDALFLYARNAREALRTSNQTLSGALSNTGSGVAEKLSALSDSYRMANLAFRSKFALDLHQKRQSL